jgi:hypothetical protein
MSGSCALHFEGRTLCERRATLSMARPIVALLPQRIACSKPMHPAHACASIGALEAPSIQ